MDAKQIYDVSMVDHKYFIKAVLFHGLSQPMTGRRQNYDRNT